jgi:polyphosphate glucokinase
MLFLGLGTGLGSTLIYEGTLIPTELAHLPYRDGESYESWVGNEGMHQLGKKRWRKHVLEIIDLFVAAFQVDYVVLGGGNARHMKDLPRYVRLGSNANAFKGGYRLWEP